MIGAVILAGAWLLPMNASQCSMLPCDYMMCPQVYRVRKAEYANSQLNLVFLPDGFTEEQLGEFRCAVKVLADSLLAEPPFDRHACRTNVYRMDLYAPESGIAALCGEPDDLEDEDAEAIKNLCRGDFSALGDSLYPCLACDTEPRTFETRTCASNIARLMWPRVDETVDRETEALELADRCAPSPSAVIIIGRTEANVGGGDTAIDRKLGLAVVGLMDIEKTFPATRLAHELGHALGLLDEYTKDGVDVPYSCGRNLFTLESGLLGPAALSCEKEPLWAEFCNPSVATGTPGSKCLGCLAEFGCEKVCCTEHVDCSEVDAPTLGLYEGGHYRTCNVFHSASSCRMQDPASAFCPVCDGVVGDRLKDAGIASCTPVLAEVPYPNELHAPPGLPVRLTHCVPKRPPDPPPSFEKDPKGGMTPAVEPCPGVFRQIRTWTAQVVIDGVVGEVPIRRAKMTIRPLVKEEEPFKLELERVRADGADKVVWRRSGGEIGKDAVLGVPDETGALTIGDLLGEIEVVDDVRGKSWKARSIRWD